LKPFVEKVRRKINSEEFEQFDDFKAEVEDLRE